jgi:hypothetical protein
MVEYGKKFESIVRRDLQKIENTIVERLPDQMSGMKGSTNTCDFVMYKKPNLFYIECKATVHETYNISTLRQYDKLKDKIGLNGVITGVIVWFVELNKIRWFPIELIKDLKEKNIKSNYYSLHSELENDKIIDLDFTKPRTYPVIDFQSFFNVFGI